MAEETATDSPQEAFAGAAASLDQRLAVTDSGFDTEPLSERLHLVVR